MIGGLEVVRVVFQVKIVLRKVGSARISARGMSTLR